MSAATLAGALGSLIGSILAAGGAWWIWGRRPPPSLSPASLPLPVPWPEDLPPPVGRQLWLAPDIALRDRALRWLAERLSRRGPVILLGGDLGAIPGVLRPAGAPLDPGQLTAAVGALVGQVSVLVAGAVPGLPSLLRASPAPVIAVLSQPPAGGPAPALTLRERGGTIWAGGAPLDGA